MNTTRLDTTLFADAVAAAMHHLLQADAILAPYLVALTEAERAAASRPSVRFPEAAKALARAAQSAPALAEGAGFDAAAVLEDVENAAALLPASQILEKLTGAVDDSRLQWLAEAYRPSLALYGAAKVVAGHNGQLQTVVDPLEDVFAARKSRAAPAGDPGSRGG